MTDPAAVSAPTGCYKCGRPGHWSRDCPSSSSTNPNPTLSSSAHPPKTSNFPSSTFPKAGGGFSGRPIDKPAATEKPKKVRKTRPKLDPELLLSDDGLGYVLRYFPRNFKFRGHGHEVGDLGKLLRMYKEWHSHLIPYYSFDQFVHKVEQVGSAKRVRTCLRGLREKVANGGDPTKWNETSTENDDSLNVEDPKDMEENANHDKGVSSPPKGSNTDDVQEAFLDEIFNQTVEEALETPQINPASMRNLGKDSVDETPESGDKSSNPIQVTEEQKARMEANRLKALERANARARLVSAA